MNPGEEEEYMKQNPLYLVTKPLINLARKFDSYTEHMLNTVMCTDLCPCHLQSKDYIDTKPDSQQPLTREGIDAWNKYNSIDPDYLRKFGRQFNKSSEPVYENFK